MPIIKLLNKNFHPEYTEVMCYLMSLTFILLTLTNTDFRSTLYAISVFSFRDIRTILMLAFFVIGVASSLFYAFSGRIIPGFIKGCMILFIFLGNLLIAAVAAKYALDKAQNWQILFPLFNVAYAVFILILIRVGIADAGKVSDVNAKPYEIITGTIVVCIVLIISQYVYHNYWVITASICLTYASAFNVLVTRAFFPNTNKPE